jgi:GTP-binding protein YchF
VEIGIVGLPLAGKTTIFNALTRSQAQTAGYSSGRCEVHTAVVDVPDPRVDILSEMFHPRKTTRAKIQFNDISGITGKGQGSNGGGLDAQVLTALSKSDALLQVVRAFASEQGIDQEGIDPQRDWEALQLDLLISDLAIVERRIERIEAGMKKARADEAAALQRELALMRRFAEALEANTPIRDLDMTEEEQTLIRGFQFLTAKPSMVVFNAAENDGHITDLDWVHAHKQTSALVLKGALEMEIAQMPPEDMQLFLEEYGLAEPGLNALVRECYRLLGLMSFFTVGEDEVRAWTVRQGATAVEAAGAIHSDLARGFIRAEVISYDDMIACGTMAQARSQGKLRLEGKQYIVQDGDILNIRFNV